MPKKGSRSKAIKRSTAKSDVYQDGSDAGSFPRRRSNNRTYEQDRDAMLGPGVARSREASPRNSPVPANREYSRQVRQSRRARAEYERPYTETTDSGSFPRRDSNRRTLTQDRDAALGPGISRRRTENRSPADEDRNRRSKQRAMVEKALRSATRKR